MPELNVIPILTEDGSYTVRSEEFGETYHSRHGAASESKLIFLEKSGVKNRLRQQQKTTILEVGLGAGLNFLLSADFAMKYHCELHYYAVEIAPLPVSLFNQLGYESLLSNPELCDLINATLIGNATTIKLQYQNINLTTYKCDIRTEPAPVGIFDALYLDAFSPTINVECWTPGMLQHYYRSLIPGGKLSTYSAQGELRRALANTGFIITKHPGPRGKREFLVAERPQKV